MCSLADLGPRDIRKIERATGAKLKHPRLCKVCCQSSPPSCNIRQCCYTWSCSNSAISCSVHHMPWHGKYVCPHRFGPVLFITMVHTQH